MCDGLEQILKNCNYHVTLDKSQTIAQRKKILAKLSIKDDAFWTNLVAFECPDDMFRICIKTSHESHLRQWMWIQDRMSNLSEGLNPNANVSDVTTLRVDALAKSSTTLQINTVTVLYVILLKQAKASITEAKNYYEFFSAQHQHKLTTLASPRNAARPRPWIDIQQKIILITRDTLTPTALLSFMHPQYEFKYFKFLFLQRNIMDHLIFQPHRELTFEQRRLFWSGRFRHTKLDDLPPLDPLDPVAKMHEWPIGSLIHIERSYPQKHDYWRIVKPRKFSFRDNSVQVASELFCFLFGCRQARDADLIPEETFTNGCLE